MSVLVPFDHCIARPEEGRETFPLTEHLIRVKQFVEKWVKTDDILTQLMGLAGVCHDVAKGHKDWQAYINRDPRYKKGPAHAPAGAFLFSYLAYQLLKSRNAWEDYCVHWLRLIRDIADHHGALKRLNEDNWVGAGEWHKMDLDGIAAFIKALYPQLNQVELSLSVLDEWTDEVHDHLEDVMEKLDLGYTQPDFCELMYHLQQWRNLTTSLIAGDRFDVNETLTSWLDETVIRSCDEHIDAYCQANHSHPLSAVRFKAQRDILEQLAAASDERIYTLEMPTGYGKTITSLKMALWLCQNKGYRKVIYVAPYLSILEQTAQVITEAMNIGVLEHHSLAVLDSGYGEKDYSSFERRLPNNQLVMESWAHPIICTSFQQWSKALFPGRAQEVLRRSFLQDSVVIIDEPQIFSPEGWNLFLCGLESVSNLNNLRIIFLSATMPPFEYGLSRQPKQLSVAADGQTQRYRVVNKREKVDEKTLAQYMMSREEKTKAAILNTIEDACRVYQAMDKGGDDVRLVHGLMIPIHKKIEIAKIQHHLRYHRNLPLTVIATQVLEAGVDVSFQHVIRALPILPSVVQAAGRVNRHFEDQQGVLTVVPFFRQGEKDTRSSIYARDLQVITDRLLDKEVFLESEMTDLIQRYYQEMFRQNTYETVLMAIRDAYEGNWPELSRFAPFGKDYFKLPLFVPWSIPSEDYQLLPKRFTLLQKRVGSEHPEEIYQRYIDRDYMNKLSYEERKAFMILFHHYVLNVPVKTALKFASQEDYLQNKIPFLFDSKAYDPISGLTTQFDETSDFII